MKYHIIHSTWNKTNSSPVNDVLGHAAGDAVPLNPANRNLRMNTKFRHISIRYQEFNTVAWTSSSVSQIDAESGNDQIA
jgi:hypothetical protein